MGKSQFLLKKFVQTMHRLIKEIQDQLNIMIQQINKRIFSLLHNFTGIGTKCFRLLIKEFQCRKIFNGPLYLKTKMYKTIQPVDEIVNLFDKRISNKRRKLSNNVKLTF